LHKEDFAYFGGVAQIIRLDNLREGVIDPDIYDPELNGLYAAEYRTLMDSYSSQIMRSGLS
jgi:hypothetical protein